MGTSVKSPGGWVQLQNARMPRKLVVGLLGLASAGGLGYGVAQGVLDVYGKFQGAQAAYYCEAQLTSETASTVTYSCLNPLPEGISGAVLKDLLSGVLTSEVPSPTTELDVGTATGSTMSGENIFKNLQFSAVGKWHTTYSSGAWTSFSDYVLVAPRNYTGSYRYVNATFSGGSGQTVSGNAPAVIRLPIVPCNLDGVGC